MFCSTLVPSPLFFSRQTPYILVYSLSLHQLLSTLVASFSIHKNDFSNQMTLSFKLSFSPFCVSFCLYWKHKTYKFQYLFQNITIFQYHPLLVFCFVSLTTAVVLQRPPVCWHHHFLSVNALLSFRLFLFSLDFVVHHNISLENILISLYISHLTCVENSTLF